jgi:hypothetical protein
MKKFLFAAAIVGSLAVTTPAHAGGVALCIETGRSAPNNGQNSDDKQYFLLSSRTTDGYNLQLEAREAFRAGRDGGSNSPTAACHNSGRYTEHGEFVVIQGGRTRDYQDAPYTRWALGSGSNRSEAIAQAIRQLRMRDGGWQERHGYSVVESGSF